MNKFIVIEVGSTNTKTFLYSGGEITEYPQVSFNWSKHYKQTGELDPTNIDAFCAFVNGLKDKTTNIFIYGTSIFRELNDTQRKNFLSAIKQQTGAEFNIVTAEQESDYTVKGVTLGNDYNGRIGIMIGGGRSTEICIVENKQVIEKNCYDFGSILFTDSFEAINDHKPNMTMEQVDKFVQSKMSETKNKTDILVIAGGDFLYFYQSAGPEVLQSNKFYNDKLQPYMVTAESADFVDRRFVLEQDINHYAENFTDYSTIWWSGARGMRFCVRAATKITGAKYIIPTKINMCLGIINELKSK